MPSDTNQPVAIGNYDLLQKIAEGGMGAVFKGQHQVTGEIVAVKIVPANLASNQVLLKRFEQEFRAARSLDHPNLVKAIEFGAEGKTPFLVMEFVDGETLGQRIDRVGKLPENEAIDVVAQIAQGLYKAHIQGLVHRDVKPDNILITPDGIAKLTDLGLVKEVETDLNLTRTGRGLGTPHFMAPEQFRNAKNANARCDVYSLAATLYMAITGELPFKSCSPLDAWMKKVQNDFPSAKQLNPEISDRVDQAVKRAMNADPEQRPATCREFVDELQGIVAARTVVARSTSSGTPTDQWYLRYKDEMGATHTVKGSLNAIRRCLKEGLLGNADNIFVSRGKAGPFEPLLTQAEFRDLLTLLPAAGAAPGVDGASKSSRPPASTFKSVPPGGQALPQSSFKSTPPPSKFKSTPPPPSKFKSTPPQSTFKSTAPSSGVMKNPGSSSRKTSVPPPSPMPGANPPSPASSSAKANLMAQTPPPGFRTPQIEIAPVTPPEEPKPLPPAVVSFITWTALIIVFLGTLITSLWFLLPPDFLQKALKWIGG
jgi:eukaryotic-like serine/threonine-protein kinase